MPPLQEPEPHRRQPRGRNAVGLASGVLLLSFASLAAAGTVDSGREAIAFRTGILPILTKAGCNTGACHGAATGQGGFKLSLLGYDPESDHERITRELGGRRLDLDAPRDSLILGKPARQLEHEGGRRLAADSPGYETLLRWIQDGARYGPRALEVQAITVTPADSLVATPNRSVTLRVTARLSDGSEQDVSALALYTSNDDAVVEVSKSGEVTTRGRGLTSVMVRYSGQVAAARVAVPFGTPGARGGVFPANNFVDRHVRNELDRLGLPPSPLSSDAEFLRRVHLDVAGRLPAPEAARTFLNSTRPGRREALIDTLLSSSEFTDLWTLRLADLLLVGGRRANDAATRAYHDWLRDQVSRNVPLDQMARTLLTAGGDVASVGPANFYTLATDPRDLAEHVGRIFLGAQIGCARCHAHPADRWTQDDYHRFAAYFARVTQDGGVVKVGDRGTVEHPKTGRAVTPKPLGAPERPVAAGADPRGECAAWITSPENPLFARSFVNRVWKHLLGRGLVEPVDDLRPSNPATNPALLDALASDFAAHGFDLRHLVRTIVSSRTYQLTSTPLEGNRLDDRFHSHALLKELPAQVFADALAQASGSPDVYEGQPPGTRAVQLVGTRTASYTLDVLGRCSRERACESPARAGGGLAQALHLINGTAINAKLSGGLIRELLDRGLADRAIVEELYLRACTRPPTAAERTEWEATLAQAGNKAEAVEDLLWTLLNSREFAFNH